MKYLFDTCSITIVIKRKLGEELSKYFKNVSVSELVRKEFNNVPDDWKYFNSHFKVNVIDIADMSMYLEMSELIKLNNGMSEADASSIVLAKKNKYILITEERLIRKISLRSGFKAKRFVELLFDLKIDYDTIKSWYYDGIKKISSLPKEEEEKLFYK